MHLASVHTRSRRGIVPIIAPRGMVEVNYKLTAIRDDGIVESQSADATPIAECAALPKTLRGKGDVTNPEQLFAEGYAACFENALSHRAPGLAAILPMATSKLSPRLASAATTRVGLCCLPRSP